MFFMLALFGCQQASTYESFATVTNDGTNVSQASVSNTLATILQYISFPNAPSDWAHRFSPDGQWYIKNSMTGNNITRFEGFSLTNPQVGFITHREFGMPLSQYQSLIEWANDSSAFIATGVNKPGAGCPYTEVIVYTYDNNNQRYFPYAFTPETSGVCVQPSWSADSKSVFITVMTDPDSIFVIDKQGNLQRKIALSWEGELPRSISPVQQVGNYLLFTVDYPSDGNGRFKREMYMVEQGEPEHLQMLFSSYDAFFSIVGIDPGGTRILIEHRERDIEYESFHLYVYDLQSNKVERDIQVQGQLVRATQRLSPYSALQIRSRFLSEETYLWLFDWENLELREYGSIAGLVTWLPPENGFLVVQSDKEDSYYFEIIQP